MSEIKWKSFYFKFGFRHFFVPENNQATFEQMDFILYWFSENDILKIVLES